MKEKESEDIIKPLDEPVNDTPQQDFMGDSIASAVDATSAPEHSEEENGETYHGDAQPGISSSKPQNEHRSNPTDSIPPKVEANPNEASFSKEIFRVLRHLIDLYRQGGSSHYRVGKGDQYNQSSIYNLNLGIGEIPKSISKTDPGSELIFDYVQLDQIFIVPRCYNKALQILQEQSLLIVHGASGSGRRTLAYHLLYRLHTTCGVGLRQVGNVDALLRDDSPDTEVPEDLVSERAYLLQLDSRGALEEKLDLLTKRLVSKNSYIIIIWPEGIEVPLTTRQIVTLTSYERPSKEEVFCKHITYLLKRQQPEMSEEECSKICDDILSNDELRDILSECSNLSRTVNFARFIVDELTSAGNSMQIVIQRCLAHRVEWLQRDAFEMIRSASGLAHLCLLFAAAVLSEINVDFFQECADELQKIFDADFSKSERKTWKRFWQGARSDWLEIAHIQIHSIREYVDERQVRVDVINLSPKALRLPLIDIFWDEYPRHRGKLLSWLELCGRHINFRVRLSAATVLGFLGLRDPLTIERNVIEPWILTGNIIFQESAAMTYAIEFGESSSAARAIRNTLEHRIENDETRPRYLFAAAIIYAWIGMDAPKEFISGINKLIKTRDVWVLIFTQGNTDGETVAVANTQQWRQSAIRFAFQRFLQLGNFTPADYKDLFGQMLTWAESGNRISRLIARQVFLDMMFTNQVLPADSWQKDDVIVNTWPVFLRILCDNSEVLPIAADLFFYVTGARRTWRTSMEGIKKMIVFAHKQPEASIVIETLIAEIIQKYPDSGFLVKQQLIHWAKGKKSDSALVQHSRRLVVSLRNSKLI